MSTNLEILGTSRPILFTSESDPAVRPLTPKQKSFVKYYVQTGNGLQSAKSAGYEGNDDTLKVQASRMLTSANVQKAIARLFDPIADTEEILGRLTRYSRSDITDVLTDSGSFDIKTAKENGTSDLIKSVKFDKETGNVTSLEIHDAHEATKDLARIQGLFVDRTYSESVNLHVHTTADERAGKVAELLAKAGRRQPAEPKE